MAYSINKTDGSILSTVADGQVDQISTDLTLIGKNYSGFGEALNENFVKLLENFSNTAEPSNPIKGQIWFDSSESKLKVYNGTTFQPVSSATISSTQPSSLGVGDLWFNDVERQLYFYDGTTTILLGPDYSSSQGLSGLRVSNILDSLNQTRVITSLYNNGVLLGIFAKDSFIPKLPINGFEGAIVPGFNAGSLSGLKFNVTVTNSESLGNQPAASYLRRDTDNIINGQLTITSNRGVLIGDSQQAQLLVINGNIQLSNDSEDKNISIRVKRNINIDEVIAIDTVNQRLNLYSQNPSSLTTIGGDMDVRGDLTINGSLIINDGDVTQVRTSELLVEDKKIILAETGDSSANSEEYADGGGMIVKGSRSHEWLYDRTNTAWVSSEHILLESGKKIYIKDGSGIPREVLTVSSLGSTITSIEGVTAFGAQKVIDVGPDGTEVDPPDINVEMRLENNRISTTKDDLDLELYPDGDGNVKLNGTAKITNMVDGAANGYVDYNSNTDAASKGYVDYTVQGMPIILSMIRNKSGGSVLTIAEIITELTVLAPPSLYRLGTVANILLFTITNSSSTLNINTYLNPPTTTEFITPDSPGVPIPGGTANGISSFNFNSATVPAQGIEVLREVESFIIKKTVGEVLYWDTP